MSNLEKEEFVQKAKELYPSCNTDINTAYDIIFGTLTYLVSNTDYRVYVPKIGVLYRKELTNINIRWMDEGSSEARYKYSLSAKPFKVKKEEST